MFEKIANMGKSAVEAVKSADIGTVGKVVAGGLLLLASTALTIAGTSAGKREEYHHVPHADQEPFVDENPVEKIEEKSEPEEADK